jgi:hypothetical protein
MQEMKACGKLFALMLCTGKPELEGILSHVNRISSIVKTVYGHTMKEIGPIVVGSPSLLPI